MKAHSVVFAGLLASAVLLLNGCASGMISVEDSNLRVQYARTQCLRRARGYDRGRCPPCRRRVVYRTRYVPGAGRCTPPPIPRMGRCPLPYVRVGAYCVHRRMAKVMVYVFRRKGFKVKDLQRGCLGRKQKFFYSVRLLPGRYMFFARNIRGSDLDMYIYGGSGRLLKKDNKRDPVPVVRFTAAVPMVVHIKLVQHGGSGPFQLLVLRRAAGGIRGQTVDSRIRSF